MKAVLAGVVGLVLGGVLTYFLLVGAPRMEKPPGQPVRAPDAGVQPAGTAVLALDENFFNTLLGTLFAEVGTPSFNLSGGMASASPSSPPSSPPSWIAPAGDGRGFRYVEAQ